MTEPPQWEVGTQRNAARDLFPLTLQAAPRWRWRGGGVGGAADGAPFAVVGGLLQNRGVSGCGPLPVLTGSVHGEEVPSGGPGSAVLVPAGYAGVAAGGSSGAPGDHGGGGSPGHLGVPRGPPDRRGGGGGV